MLKNKGSRLIHSPDYLKLILCLLIIFSFLFPLKTGETAESVTITDNDQNIHITPAENTVYYGCCLGHLGGSAVGDINGDGIDDFIVSSLFTDIERYEKTYLPPDHDAWTENDISLWSTANNLVTAPTLSADSVAGNYSISTTRTASGWTAMKLTFPAKLILDPARDILHLWIYTKGGSEQLDKIRIYAPVWGNHFEYDASNLTLNDAGWTRIDLNLSDFSSVGLPEWNNVSKIVISFLHGTAESEIRIDNLYFDHYSSTTVRKAGAVYLFYGGFTANHTVDEADVVIEGIDRRDMTGEYITTGDINNDGFDDIIIGAPGDDGPDNARKNSGAVYVVFGGGSLPAAVDLRTGADYTVYGIDPGDKFGQSVYASDIDGDRIPDLIIGAINGEGYENNGGYGSGEIHIISGSAQLSGVLDLGSGSNADISIYGKRDYEFLGTQATIGIGDIYNDGQADIIIGVWAGERPEALPYTNAGNVLIINDISNYLNSVIDLAFFTPDTIIHGADNYDRLSRIAIGDINNDGIDDIIAGAESAAKEAGKVFVFFGSSSFQLGEIDLKTTDADITITGADNSDYISVNHIESEHSDIPDHLGLKVYASDISNDGIDDILIIAPGGNGENNDKKDSGNAYAIYGGPDLPRTINLADTLPDLTVYSADNRIDEDGSSRGDLRDIIGGDISGDGINDLILGYRYTGQIVALYDGFYRQSDNNPPSKPQLISPVDGQTGLGTTVEFRWRKSTDPDGDLLTYTLHVCDMSDCITVENAVSPENKNIFYAGTGSGLLLFGIVLAGGIRGKKKTTLLLLTMIMAASLFLASCGSGGGGSQDDILIVPPSNGNEITRTVPGLSPGTTYIWKVLVDDGRGGITESEFRSFTTR